MGTQRGLPDDLLASLAEDVETGEQMESLGRALGFNAAAINRYTETNRLEGRVTCKGTRDMLFDWRQTLEPNNQHLKLKEALTEAGLVMLADNYLKEATTIQDIYSEKISYSLTVDQCREKLANKYLSKLCKIQMKPWDPDDYAEFEDMHTVVTMVTKDAQGRDMKKKMILQGSVDKIFSTTINGKLPARILISAPAGKGKTTAVAKMAYDWAKRVKGSALEHLPLLFVLKLRSAGQLTSIGEAIKSQLLSDVVDLTPEVMEHFIRENQGICHIILDGLDEYAGITSSKKSLGSNIVDVMLWKQFPECRVLVTTRPHLENFFNQEDISRVYSKMWIEGFSRDNSREYIDKFFASTSKSSKGQGLKTYLDSQPLINELVITPLFCLMVCHLWNEGLLKSNTTTQTELLSCVNQFLLLHANARSEAEERMTNEKLDKIICQLGGVALAGLLDDTKKLVFTPLDFRRAPAILDIACELGIVSKTTVSSTRLPHAKETSFTTIEFYHKLAQEHSAGKYLAAKTKKYMLRLKISKLDRVLRKIRSNIGDYENLIRFAAGTEKSLGIRIMETLLSNSFLDESERYRILLDCSSETSDTEGSVSSLVKRCVTAQRIVLKSPTVYTVVGMRNLPEELKYQIRELKFEDSAISADVTSGLWSCLLSFLALRNLTVSDSSLSFTISPPELQFVTKLKAEGVTSPSFVGLLSSLPGLKEIDITIDDAEGDIPQITAGLRRTGGEWLTHIAFEAPAPLPLEKKNLSRETMRGLGLLIREHIKNLQSLSVSGVKCIDEDYVDLIQSSTILPHLHFQFLRWGSLERNNDECTLSQCQLSTEMTVGLWTCLTSFLSLRSLIISDSSLSFPPSPPELSSITKLKTERVKSQSYEGLLSSLPGLKEIDITIVDAERDISQITAGLRRTGGQQLTRIALEARTSFPSEMKNVSRETMRGMGLLIREQTKNLYRLWLTGVKCTDEDDFVDLIECCRHVKEMEDVKLFLCGTKGGGRLESHLESLRTLCTPGDTFTVWIRHDTGAACLGKISHNPLSF